MKKLLATVAVACLASVASTASAQDYATITRVEPTYQNVSVPRHRTDCVMNEVPIYGNSGQASTGDTIVGAVIGGALGNQVGGGKGKDAMTVLGAIIGADVVNKRAKNRQIIGYREQQTCHNVTFHETYEELKNYRITYEYNGTYGQSYTHNKYRVGDRLRVTVTIQAN